MVEPRIVNVSDSGSIPGSLSTQVIDILRKAESSLDYVLRFSQFHYHRNGKYKGQYADAVDRIREIRAFLKENGDDRFMALNAKDAPGGGGDYEKLESGTYPARLVQVIDLGLQNQEFKGEVKAPRREIALTYEFLDEFIKDEDGNEQEDKPRWLTEMMPLYNLNSEKAKSTQRYKALDPDEVHEGDFSALIGTPVSVTIVQNPGTGKHKGKVFENIDSVAPMRRKDAERAPELVNEATFFDFDDPDLEVFLSLPKFLKDRIQNNLEFAGSRLSKLLGNAENPPSAQEESDEDHTDSEENPY